MLIQVENIVENSKGVSYEITETIEEYSEIIPDRIYLGNFKIAMSPKGLKTLQITHVLYVSGFGGNCCERKWIKEEGNSSTIKWKTIKIRDFPDQNIAQHFEACFEFLDNAMSDPASRILIHCQAGVSRSSTVCIAYLMKLYNWTLDEAFRHVLQRRTIIKPNEGFMEQLIDFHLKMHQTEKGSEECIRRKRLNYLKPVRTDKANKDK